jgi:oleate hydratase
MRAHIVGGGFGGLAAAALLIRNAGTAGEDIVIYEADERVGGGFFLDGSAERGYNLPGSVFDKEFRCTFDLLKSIPSASDPSVSVTEAFFAFNTGEPYQDKAHIFDRDGRLVHGPRFGLSLGDGLSLARVLLTPKRCWTGGASRSSSLSVFSRPISGFCGRRSWGRCPSTARSSFAAT